MLAPITVRMMSLLLHINASWADKAESAQAQETATENLWHEEQKEASKKSDRMSFKDMHLQYMRTSLSLCGIWRAASLLAETTAASAAQKLPQMHATM